MKFELARLRAARAPLRDRRRGRQHPDRRGAHAADHLGPGRGIDRPVLRSRPHHPAAEAGRGHQGDVKAEDRERLEATGDYIVDEKHKTVTLTESGMAKAEQLLAHRLQPGGLYDPANMALLHHVNQALRAHTLYQRDVDYMIKDGEVVIVDEFTGRLMPGRRWSDGLHQAVEAKERVKIEHENQTLATITFQNYFRKYKKLAGMTGTAETEADRVRQDLQARRHRHPDQPAD